MIDLNTKEVVFTMKIINLNIKVSIKKIIVDFVFEIDSNNIYIKMALINQDIIVLF